MVTRTRHKGSNLLPVFQGMLEERQAQERTLLRSRVAELDRVVDHAGSLADNISHTLLHRNGDGRDAVIAMLRGDHQNGKKRAAKNGSLPRMTSKEANVAIWDKIVPRLLRKGGEFGTDIVRKKLESIANKDGKTARGVNITILLFNRKTTLKRRSDKTRRARGRHPLLFSAADPKPAKV